MRQLPQAKLVSLPGAAHMLHFDQPDRWVELVVQATEGAQSRLSPTATQSVAS